MSVELHCGDCLDVMKTLPESSVSSIVTDPPYGLSFMGKDWDHGVPGVAFWEAALRVAKPGAMLLAFGGTRTFHRLTVAIEDAGWEIRDCLMWLYGSGFPKGKRLDEHASRHYQAGDLCQCDANKRNSANTYPLRHVVDHICMVATWGATAHDLLPNADCGHCKSEDCRDDCHPLSHSCDELLRQVAANVLASVQPQEYAQGHSRFDVRVDALEGESLHSLFRVLCSDLPTMQGYLHPSSLLHAEQLLRAYGDDRYHEADLRTMLSSMAGSLDVSKLMGADTLGSHKPHIYSWVFCLPLPILRMLCDRNYKTIIPQMEICCNCNGLLNRWSGWNVALKPAWEPIIMAMKPLDGTFANNALVHGVAGLNIDQCRIGTERRTSKGMSSLGVMHDDKWIPRDIHTEAIGRWPANLILNEESAAMLDEQTGVLKAVGHYKEPNSDCDTDGRYNATSYELKNTSQGARRRSSPYSGQDGGASRFFYCAKASKRDRDEGLEGMELKDVGNAGRHTMSGDMPKNYTAKDGVGRSLPRANTHPTVKPTALMQWLVRLVTPPGGTVLDPFCGSGSTGKAAVLEGFNFVGIELDAEYLAIAERRIAHALAQAEKPTQAQPALLEVA